MGPRIEVVEVLSYRLQVPRRALERLTAEFGPLLPLRLDASEDGTLRLGPAEGDSLLRFRPKGETAELVDIIIADDAGGRFFQVLGALMMRFRGDLRVRLVYDPAEAAPGEPWVEVRIDGGQTSWPGLATQAAAARLARAASEGGEVQASEDEDPELPLTPEEEELDRLLRQAEAHWQEYLRLKGSRQP